MARIAINGLGRIARAALKIALSIDGADATAVNDLIPAGQIAHLLRYDTVLRTLRHVNGHPRRLADHGRAAGRGPRLPGCPGRSSAWTWVLAYTGAFRREEGLRKHLAAGARFVILPAPARAETVATVV